MSHGTTQYVLNALPKAQKDFWGVAPGTLEMLNRVGPGGVLDYYCGARGAEKRRLDPYVVFLRYPGDRPTRMGLNNKGRLFHYMPVDTDVSEGCGAWQSDSEDKWRFAQQGFHWYARRILGWLNEGRKADALLATTALFHFLQDQTAFFHALEGEEGCSPWILDELIDRPAWCRLFPAEILHEATPEFSMADYNPMLLGESIEEFCFHLYRRYRQVKHDNRLRLVPLVMSHYGKNASRECAIRRQIGRATAELTADVIYSLYCMATGQAPAAKVKTLERVCLCDLKPIDYHRHSRPPYRHHTMIFDHALDCQGRQRPLALNVKSGNCWRERTFERGIGVGLHRVVTLAYPVPARVFRRFEGVIGLHSKLCGKGELDFDLRLGNKKLLACRLGPAQPSARISVPLISGGILRFRFCSQQSFWRMTVDNLVLGEPYLVK